MVLLFQIPKFFIVSCSHKYAFPAAISLEFAGIMQLKSLKYGSGWGCLGIWRTCNQTSKTDFQEGVPCMDLPPQHQKILTLIKMVFDNIFIIKSHSFACPQAFAYQLYATAPWHFMTYDLITVKGFIISPQESRFIRPSLNFCFLDCSEDVNSSQISFWVFLSMLMHY